MIVLLDLEGIVVFTSHAIERVLGYGHDELVGRRLTELIDPDDLERLQPAHAETLETGRSPLSRARLRHRDGRWIAVEANATAVLDEHGRPKQLLAVVRELA